MDGPTHEEFEQAAREARVLEVRVQAGQTIDERLAGYLAHCAEVARWQAARPGARHDRDRTECACRLERIFGGPQASPV